MKISDICAVTAKAMGTNVDVAILETTNPPRFWTELEQEHRKGRDFDQDFKGRDASYD